VCKNDAGRFAKFLELNRLEVDGVAPSGGDAIHHMHTHTRHSFNAWAQTFYTEEDIYSTLG